MENSSFGSLQNLAQIFYLIFSDAAELIEILSQFSDFGQSLFPFRRCPAELNQKDDHKSHRHDGGKSQDKKQELIERQRHLP